MFGVGHQRQAFFGQRPEVANMPFAENPLANALTRPQTQSQFDGSRELFTQYEDYADAYIGDPLFMGRMYSGLLMLTTSSFLTEKIMPKLYSPKTDLTWEKLIFNKTQLPKVPSEAPGRYLHHRSEKGYARTERYGEAIHLEQEFQNTPRGREMLGMQLIQLNNNALITANMLIMAKLCNLHQNENLYLEQYAKTGVAAMDLVEDDIAKFVLVSKKGGKGLEELVNGIHAVNNYKQRQPLNAIILPAKLKMYVTNEFDEQARTVFPGEKGLPINNSRPGGAFGSVGGIPVYEAPDYSEITDTTELQPMRGMVMIGGWFPVLSEGESPNDIGMRTIKVVNESAGCDFPLDLKSHFKGALWESLFGDDHQFDDELNEVTGPNPDAPNYNWTEERKRYLRHAVHLHRIFGLISTEQYNEAMADANVEAALRGLLGANEAERRTLFPEIAAAAAAGGRPAVIGRNALFITSNLEDIRAYLIRHANDRDEIGARIRRMSFIDFRPAQKYATTRAVICRGGPELGRLMIGPTDFTWSQDGTIKTYHGFFTIWMNAIIIDGSNAYMMENLTYEACLKGCDTEFFTHEEMRQLKEVEYVFTDLDDTNSCYRKSIMCFPLPYDILFQDLPKILDMTGRFNDSYNNNKPLYEVNASMMGYYPGAEFYSRYLVPESMMRSPMGMEFVPRIPRFNTICPREYFRRCTNVANREFNSFEENQNHHGPIEKGFDKVRRGLAAPIQVVNTRIANYGN